IVHALLERGDGSEAIREARPRLIEHDEPRERGEPSKHMGPEGNLPLELEMRYEPRNVDEIEWALSDDPIRDVDVAALGVTRLGDVGHLLTPVAAKLTAHGFYVIFIYVEDHMTTAP